MLDDTGTRIAFDQNIRNGNNFRIFTPLLYPGPYYVDVRGYDSGPYILHVDVDLDQDHHGGTTETATVLMLEDYYGDGGGFTSEAGRIDPGDDADFFRLVINRTAQVTILTTGLLDTEGSLLNDEGTLIASNDDGYSNKYGFSGNFNFRIFTLPQGTYSVKVGSVGGATGAYTLWVDVEVDLNEADRIPLATALTLGTSKTVTIQRDDEHDIFRLEITSDSQVTIWTTGQLYTEGELFAYRNAPIPFGTYIAFDEPSDDDPNFRITTTLTPGLYYVKVYGELGDGGETEGTYTLHVDVVSINGGGGSDGGGSGDDHGDTRDTATTLTLGTPATGMLISDDDVDLFRLEIINPTRLEIYTTGRAYLKGSLLDDTGTRIAFDEEAGDGGNFKIFTPLLDPGLYYVDVRGYDNERTYTLHVDVDGVQDHHSDTAETATVLTLGRRTGETEEAGRIDSGNDVDFFRLEITRTALVFIATTGLLDTRGELFDSEMNSIASSDDGLSNEYGFSGNFLFFIFALPEGTYYVKVGSEGGATGAYTLFVEVEDDDDDIERIAIASAKTLAPGTPEMVTFSEDDDLDYFRLEITSDSQVTIWTTGQFDTDGVLLAYTENEIAFTTFSARDEDSGAEDNFRIATTLTPGIYYVRVRSEHEYDETEGTYILHVDVVPINGGDSGDDHGDTRDTATPLTLDHKSTGESETEEAGRIDSGDDVDFFRLEITRIAPLYIATTGLLDTRGELFDSSMNSVASSEYGFSGNFSFLILALPEGTYYIKVGSKGGATGTYTLDVELTMDGVDVVASFLASVPTLTRGTPETVSIPAAEDYADHLFRLVITHNAQVKIYTMGELPTDGELELRLVAYHTGPLSAFLTDLAEVDHPDATGGDDSNFSITATLTPGVYYVNVQGYSDRGEASAFTLHVDVVPISGGGGGGGNDNGGGSGGGAMDGGILLLLLLVCLAGAVRSLSLTPHSPRPCRRGD